MAAIDDLVVRVRTALSVSAEYDEELRDDVEGAARSLLRRYNFPKSIKRSVLQGFVAGQQQFDLPAGFKRMMQARFYDPIGLAWGDTLPRRDAFVLPSSSEVPTRYWIEGTKLWIDTPLQGGYQAAQLILLYQSGLVADNLDWMVEDFEDILINYTVYRTAPSKRKPEVGASYQQLWAADQTELAIYLNELEFDELELVMREEREPRFVERYPVR